MENEEKKLAPPHPPERPEDQTPMFVRGIRRSKDGKISPQHNLTYGRHGRQKAAAFSIAKQRIREIERLIKDQHGMCVPPDVDDGDIYVELVAHHLRTVTQSLPEALAGWRNRWAPHIPDDDLTTIIEKVVFNPQFFTAERLGKLLGLKYETRKRLDIRTIGSVDVTKAQRAEIQRDNKRTRDRRRSADVRRKRGAKLRADYLAESLSSRKPWEHEEISRSTYERQLRLATSTSDQEIKTRLETKQAA